MGDLIPLDVLSSFFEPSLRPGPDVGDGFPAEVLAPVFPLGAAPCEPPDDPVPDFPLSLTVLRPKSVGD
jgi:hypothetical protein